MLDEHRDVLATLAERGNPDHHDRDTVVEIGAEGAGVGGFLGILVGGRHETNVRTDRLGPADLDELTALNHAQQLGLEIGAELAQLVDEERAVIGLRKYPFTVFDGAGERAPHVTEELALGEALGHGGAIEGDQRPVAAIADRMDRARDQLLARSALAVDADVRVACRRLLDAREDVQDLLRSSDESVEGCALAPRGHPRRWRG